MGKAGRNTVNTTNKVAAGTGMATESVINVGQIQMEEKSLNNYKDIFYYRHCFWRIWLIV